MLSQHYKRYLNINLPAHQSAFLWGARKTGKSTYLKNRYPNAIYYDLLQSDLAFRLMRSPHEFREEILALDPKDGTIIIVDEVQKIPALMDEIHWLIENTSFQFILCGSSARKLKRQGANLLGGRAWKYSFFPLTYSEITDFDLLRVFSHGTLPSHYHAVSIQKTLQAYVEDYLTWEIQAEGLVRNLPAFARFLESLRFCHGEMVNYSNIGRECSIDPKTVKEYFQILIETLLGYFIYPYRKKIKREIISDTPRFYLFDVGVANKIKQQTIKDLKGIEAGRSLEHYIFLELIAYKHLNDRDFDITYWRTKAGVEVDFVLGAGEVTIEVKIADHIDKNDVKGLSAFMEEHHSQKNFVVALVPRARKMEIESGSIDILPVEAFLEQLWAGKII